MDPTMREAADRGWDDGRYIRGGLSCWLEGDLVPEGFKRCSPTRFVVA